MTNKCSADSEQTIIRAILSEHVLNSYRPICGFSYGQSQNLSEKSSCALGIDSVSNVKSVSDRISISGRKWPK